MLDIPRLDSVRLSPGAWGQRAVAHTFLAPNYRWAGVEIRLEGTENLPPVPVIFAMNHTDRYNYWPFQYALYRRQRRFTVTWVKGKYFEKRWLGEFLARTNNLPTVSRGYIIARDFLSTLGRRPSDEEYAALRARVNAAALAAPSEHALPDEIPRALLTTPRDMLGYAFDPTRESWEQAVLAVFRRMMARFVQLHEEAFAHGFDLIIFPEGTRSRRLSRGHIGLAEVALAFDKPIVPVGCSGSDRLYPGGAPVAKGGEVTYRIGAPLSPEEVAPFRVPRPFAPFDPQIEAAHREKFQGLVDHVMNRIDALVDPEYRFAEDGGSPGVVGSQRFL